MRLPKTCPTHGIEPPYPPFSRECFAERPAEGQRGVKRGQGNHTVPLPPLVPAGEHRLSRPPKAATVHAHFEREAASSGTPLDRRKGLPPADDKVFKDLQSLLQRLFLKSLAFHPAVRYNKTTRRGKAFTSRIFLTALSLRKGAKAIRTAGSNAEHGNFVALLNFYKLAD